MNNSDVMPRRAGRVAFGLVLIAGALYLATHARAIEHSFDWPNQAAQGLHAWHVVVGTWLAALTASVLVTSVAALIPIGIPTAFVAVTGLPIVPLLRYMEKVAATDREDSRDIPYAIRIA